MHKSTTRWLRLMVLAVAFVLGPLPANAAARNILLLIADDFGIDVASFYPTSVRRETSPPAPKMPNLQSLAKRGMLFTRVWAQPLCSPTRASILTGRYGFRTGIGRTYPSAPALAFDEITLPEVIRDAGTSDYLLANLGKWHLSGGDFDPNLQGWEHYAGSQPGLGTLPSYYRWPKTVDGVTTTSTTYATTDTVDETLAVIRRAAIERRPYFAWVAFHAPHNPYETPPAHLHSRHDLPAAGATARDYFEAMVEAMDTEIGRLMREVDLATTTVTFLGDNGTHDEATAPPYRPDRAKGTVYQGGVHVPLLFAGAGVTRPGRKILDLVDTTDLFPTILELADIDPSRMVPATAEIDGVSLLPYLKGGRPVSPRRLAYVERFGKRYDRKWQRAIRDSRYVLIERFSGPREFYDLAADPLQKDNLLDRRLTATENRRLRKLDRKLDALLASR